MIAAFAVLIVLAGTAANLHWHGCIAAEQEAEANRLTDWACRLVAHETHTTLYDQTLEPETDTPQ
jgi:hypothetical protein